MNAPFVEEIRAILMRPEVRDELMHGVWAPADDIPRLYAKCIDALLDKNLFDWDWMPLQSTVAALAREEEVAAGKHFRGELAQAQGFKEWKKLGKEQGL